MATATLKAKLTLNDTAYQAGLRKAVTLAKTAGAKIKGALSAGLRLGVGAGALGAALGGAALAKGIKGAYDMGGALSDLMARSGEAGESLIVLGQALTDAGVEGGNAGTILNKMQRALTDASRGSKKLSETFTYLGIDVNRLMRESPARQFEEIGRAINRLPSAAEKAATAMDIFGKSGGELLAVFADDNAISGAQKTLGSMTAILANNAATFDTISDRLSHVGKKFEGFMVGVAAEFAPAMLAVTAAIERTDFAAQGERFGRAMQQASEIFAGIWSDPGSILQSFSDFLHSMWAKAANFMVASFVKGFKVVGGYMLEAVNKFRAAHIAVFEEIMSRIPGSGYDKNKTIRERMADSLRSGSGRTLGRTANGLKNSELEIKDLFGANRAMRYAKQELEKVRQKGAEIQSRARQGSEFIGPQLPANRPEMIGPQLPRGWKPNQFSNFKTMGFGAGGLTSGGLTSGGLDGGAYGRIKRGDAARAKAEAAKVKDPMEKAVDHLATIENITRQAWAN